MVGQTVDVFGVTSAVKRYKLFSPSRTLKRALSLALPLLYPLLPAIANPNPHGNGSYHSTSHAGWQVISATYVFRRGVRAHLVPQSLAWPAPTAAAERGHLGSPSRDGGPRALPRSAHCAAPRALRAPHPAATQLWCRDPWVLACTQGSRHQLATLHLTSLEQGYQIAVLVRSTH